MNVYIFGAHSRARTTAKYITTIEPATKVVGFLVCNDEDNPNSIAGIPVIDISENCELDTKLSVYIGTRGIYWDEITTLLRAKGFSDIKPVDMKLDSILRNEYLKITMKKNGQTYDKFNDMKVVESRNVYKKSIIFSMASVNDGILKDSYKMKEYEEIMQVGASLSDIRLENVLDRNVKYFDDFVEDNISKLNRQFCELTGLYAVWKMDTSEYDFVGVCHYRRHFILPESWEQIAFDNKVDVILPVPLYVDPSLDENYRFRHVGSDLDLVYEYVNKIYPQMGMELREFMKRSIYSPCNMIIARPEVYSEMCSWLFPILLELHERVGTREDIYQNRYPGFISERLISFFFEYNNNKYRRVFTDKNFLT